MHMERKSEAQLWRAANNEPKELKVERRTLFKQWLNNHKHIDGSDNSVFVFPVIFHVKHTKKGGYTFTISINKYKFDCLKEEIKSLENTNKVSDESIRNKYNALKFEENALKKI